MNVQQTRGGAVVYFDDGCGVCQRFRRFVERRDGGRRLRFRSLLEWRPERPPQPEGPPYNPYADTVIVITTDGRELVRSQAVLYVLRSLGSGWKLVALFGRLVPTPLADRAYDWVAQHRHCTLSR